MRLAIAGVSQLYTNKQCIVSLKRCVLDHTADFFLSDRTPFRMSIVLSTDGSCTPWISSHLYNLVDTAGRTFVFRSVNNTYNTTSPTNIVNKTMNANIFLDLTQRWQAFLFNARMICDANNINTTGEPPSERPFHCTSSPPRMANKRSVRTTSFVVLLLSIPFRPP